MTFFQQIAIFGIQNLKRLKHALYPLLYSTFGFVSVCRHKPSCSDYAIQQIERHGTILGLYRGLVRISHCY